jgi:hypothetical protein
MAHPRGQQPAVRFKSERIRSRHRPKRWLERRRPMVGDRKFRAADGSVPRRLIDDDGGKVRRGAHDVVGGTMRQGVPLDRAVVTDGAEGTSMPVSRSSISRQVGGGERRDGGGVGGLSSRQRRATSSLVATLAAATRP